MPVEAKWTPEVDGQVNARGAMFARFFALGDDDEPVERETLRIDRGVGLAFVIARCADFGEQADLLDLAGFVIGNVYCDGALEWWV